MQLIFGKGISSIISRAGTGFGGFLLAKGVGVEQVDQIILGLTVLASVCFDFAFATIAAKIRGE